MKKVKGIAKPPNGDELKTLCNNHFDPESEEFVVAWMLRKDGIWTERKEIEELKIGE